VLLLVQGVPAAKRKEWMAAPIAVLLLSLTQVASPNEASAANRFLCFLSFSTFAAVDYVEIGKV
jgi:hypothetical protein